MEIKQYAGQHSKSNFSGGCAPWITKPTFNPTHLPKSFINGVAPKGPRVAHRWVAAAHRVHVVLLILQPQRRGGAAPGGFRVGLLGNAVSASLPFCRLANEVWLEMNPWKETMCSPGRTKGSQSPPVEVGMSVCEGVRRNTLNKL